MMIYAVLREPGKQFPENAYLFYTWRDFHAATFSPDIEELCVIELGRLKGKTYAERKADIEAKAIEYSHNMEGGLSYGELSDIQEYFERYGRRYGLLTDFHENAIC